MLLSEMEAKVLEPGQHFVVEERNGLIEALHRSHVAVVDSQGNIRFSSGDPHHFTYTRSCIKPIQALPVLYLGAADRFDFDQREIAMCAASHSGQEEHIELVKSMMEKIGITEKDLKCGGHEPFHKPTAKALSGKYSVLHDNCSGKHTGALAVCKHMGWDSESYIDLDHPLTKEIVKLISDLTGLRENGIHLGKDGCDIPNFGLPISKMAQLFAILADPREAKYDDGLEKMRDIFISHPRIIGGEDRFDTIMMEDHPGALISKAGAAGLQTMAAKIGDEWLGISVKIEDGSYPACESLSFNILKEIGLYESDGKGKKFDPKIIKTRSKKMIGSFKTYGKLMIYQ